jgi:DNA-binding beta-propeller fold protein YncE
MPTIHRFRTRPSHRTRRRTAVAAAGLLTALIGGSLGTEPSAQALASGRGAYVATSTATAVIDTDTATLAAAVPGAANHVVLTPDGSVAYSSHTATDTVRAIDTTTDSDVAIIAAGDAPSDLAMAPDGATLYVTLGTGEIAVVDTTTNTTTRTIAVPGADALAVSPDGSTLYVAAGAVQVVDVATGSITATIALGGSAGGIVVSPDGARAYVTEHYLFDGNVAVLDLASNTVSSTLFFGSVPGAIAMSPDGRRVYVGVQATWVDTGYGAGFFNGRSVSVLSTATNTWIGAIDLGAAGSNWSQQNTPAGIAVTSDQSAVYIAVPRLGSVVVAGYQTHANQATIPVGGTPGHIAIAPRGGPGPYTVDAVDDSAASTTDGGVAVANVLANDRIGGVTATLADVTLEQTDSSDAAIALDVTTGQVLVGATVAVGTHTLGYRICDTLAPTVCDTATVTIAVRAAYVIDAVDDAATSKPARTAITNVLANDTLDGITATTATVRITQVAASSTKIAINPANGSVFVYAGAPGGEQTVDYRICEIASPVSCDTARVTITVTPFVVDAVNDAGTVSRSGGTAVTNVLANDTIDGLVATTSRVTLSTVAASTPGISLSATGVVTVASATAAGTHTLDYRICETASPANCDTARVTITVAPYVIDAVNDSGKGASKRANTVIANVLANDRLAGQVATTSTVTLTKVSSTNAKITLTSTGAVQVTGKTSSGVFTLVYRICEKAAPTNCDTATVTIELSGGL